MTYKELCEIEKKVDEYLQNNQPGMWEVYVENNGVVVVDIRWGDWKHHHLRCKWLMQEIGYEEVSSFVTEEDGSDCYSATHYFRKAA